MTKSREGGGILSLIRCRRSHTPADRTVAVIGNPNVGKSTVFNALTGLSRHTGNWTGKTVDTAVGIMKHGGRRFALVDLPGCYSLEPTSPEEERALSFIMSRKADAALIVCDAVCLERSLNIVLQTLSFYKNAVVCVNLIDEANKRGIRIDGKLLSELLGVKVVFTDAKNKIGLDELKKAIARAAFEDGEGSVPDEIKPMWTEAERLSRLTVVRDSDARTALRLKLDRFLTGRLTGRLLMLGFLAVIFFITMAGANIPSGLLSKGLDLLLERIKLLLEKTPIPESIVSAFTDGGLNTLFTVVSVMLPPMAIFFPLFTLLEDIGLLPRIAFNLDKSFSKCGGCGKCALTMCMGFGCNAAGVVGCRIIESPRERLIAVLTNSLVPCNGRFPALTALITAFFVTGGGILFPLLGAAWLTGFILLGIFAVLAVSKLLSVTFLKNSSSSFVLELPPFRKPKIGQILIRSLLDRTAFLLGRAALTAFPAGILIYILEKTGGLDLLIRFLEPAGSIMGLDGAVLSAFLLGLPANELILPMILSIRSVNTVAALSGCGFTFFKAFQTALFMLFHSPCLTTLLTVKKETGSVKMTLAALLIPTLIGAFICTLTNALRLLLGL